MVLYLFTETFQKQRIHQPGSLSSEPCFCLSVQVFRDTDLVLPYRGKSGLERLAFRLEYITCSAELTTTLQVGACEPLLAHMCLRLVGYGTQPLLPKPSLQDTNVHLP